MKSGLKLRNFQIYAVFTNMSSPEGVPSWGHMERPGWDLSEENWNQLYVNIHNVYMQVSYMCCMYVYLCAHSKNDPRLSQRWGVWKSNPKRWHTLSTYSGSDKAKYLIYLISFNPHIISLSEFVLSILQIRLTLVF